MIPISILGIVTIEILEGEPVSSDGLVYRYKVKKHYQPFKVHKKPKIEKPASPKTPDLDASAARRASLGKLQTKHDVFMWKSKLKITM